MDYLSHSHEPTVFTSWKEIAQYVGKGVRTVQRWEAEQGFPVHSVFGRKKRSIVAFPNEIDSWLQSKELRTASVSDLEMDELRRSLTELRIENATLLIRIEELQKILLQTAAADQEKRAITLQRPREAVKYAR